jgi:hypothetical protein
MMKKIILILGIMILISSCEKDELEITNFDNPQNEIVIYECTEDVECNRFNIDYLVFNYDKCINNSCVDKSEQCVNISKIDYNLKKPSCGHTIMYQCYCKDYKIISERREIVFNNSILIKEEIGEYDGGISFILKGDEQQ